MRAIGLSKLQGCNTVQGSSNFNFLFAGEIPIYDYSNESQFAAWSCGAAFMLSSPR